MSDLHRLKERIEQASGPDRELDTIVALSVGLTPETWDMGVWRSKYPPLPPPYTASLDAAIALVERLLPEWRWEVRSVGTAILHQQEDYDGINDVVEVAATAPLALLSALLAALSKDSDHA